MESAEVVFIGVGYGFAQVVKFRNKKPISTNGAEEIFFRFYFGYKIKDGRNKPKFNYKRKLKEPPKNGACIVFIRNKSKNPKHRDEALVWGTRNNYEESWKRINDRKKQKKKQQELDRLFHLIETEKCQEIRKAL